MNKFIKSIFNGYVGVWIVTHYTDCHRFLRSFEYVDLRGCLAWLGLCVLRQLGRQVAQCHYLLLSIHIKKFNININNSSNHL